MLHIFEKLTCKHEYEYLCFGSNSYSKYHFYKCKKCGKTKIVSIES